MKTPTEYKAWIALKLIQHKISRDYLLGLMIILERVLTEERYKLTGRKDKKPFYNLHDGEGNHSRAWLHASEIAIWLKYRGYKPVDWFKATCTQPEIKRRLKHREQIPLNMIMPSTRKGSAKLKEAEKHYRGWLRHNY